MAAGFANAIVETESESPRDGTIPARLATDCLIPASSLFGTVLSIINATESRLTDPGATTVRWTVLSTPNEVVPDWFE